MKQSFLLLSIGLVLVITNQSFTFAWDPLNPEQIEYCLNEADSMLPSLPIPEILGNVYIESKRFSNSVGSLVDISHEFAEKVQSLLSPAQQVEFDQACKGFWPKMIQLRDSTSCKNNLEHFIGIYSLERNNYLANHQLFDNMIQMYELCFSIHCKQAYDRKQAREKANNVI